MNGQVPADFGSPGFSGHLLTLKCKTRNWLNLSSLLFKHNPVRLMMDLQRMPWVKTMLKANRVIDMYLAHRTGPYREANAALCMGLVASISEMLDNYYNEPDRFVMHEDLVPPEILYGMGLHPWMGELLGIVLPFIDTEIIEDYIDRAESEGTPPDVCSLPKSTMGIALSGHMPQPVAIITSNMPCDGGMTSYAVIEKKLGVKSFRLDVPYNFHTERAVDYFAGELKRMIAWLEENTPGRMDWDRMREVCERRNRTLGFELEIWEMMRRRPSPMAGEPIYLGHMMYGIAQMGSENSVRLMQKVAECTRKNYESGTGAIPGEKYRIALWNPPTLMYPELFTWAEVKYRAAMIMDMLTFNRHPVIDTKSPETMLRGLARILMEGPMARHTRGPMDNFFSDLFALYKQFDMDMIWMAAHIGCKNTQALLGIFREKCRKRGIPLLIINYDLSDTRIVPAEGIRKQVDEFMENVMRH
jgi:benzoyl-CoA reductase/2-hydroxyglutaryl-CoA dehydratase subunit BcrC/BadD/HgdB